MKKLLYLALTAFLASLFSLSPVYAQDTMATLEEIVVTARKREENLQEVPVSISVISADLMPYSTCRPRTRLCRFVWYAPGVQFFRRRDRFPDRAQRIHASRVRRIERIEQRHTGMT